MPNGVVAAGCCLVLTLGPRIIIPRRRLLLCWRFNEELKNHY